MAELLRLQRLAGNRVVLSLLDEAGTHGEPADPRQGLALQRHSLTVDELNEDLLEGHPGTAVQRWFVVDEKDTEDEELEHLRNMAATGTAKLNAVIGTMGGKKEQSIVRHIGKMYRGKRLLPTPGVMVPVNDIDWLYRHGAATKPQLGQDQLLYHFRTGAGEEKWDIRGRTSAGGYTQGQIDVRYPEAFQTDQLAKGFLIHEGLHAVQHDEKVMEGAGGDDKFYREFAAYWAQSLVAGSNFSEIAKPADKAKAIADYIVKSPLYRPAADWFTAKTPAEQDQIRATLAQNPFGGSGVEWWHTDIHIRRILGDQYDEKEKLAEWGKLGWNQKREVKKNRALKDRLMASAGFGTELYNTLNG